MPTRCALVASLLILASGAVAEDWPCWRGPRGDGTWRAPPLPARWPDGGPKQRWRKPIGAGYSGVTVAAGRAYTLDRPEPSEKSKTPDGAERVLCFATSTGEKLWSHEYPAHYGDLDYGNGPRANATVVDGKVYTLGAVGHVCCLDAKSGGLLWSRDTVKELGARLPTWGFAASPLVINEIVVVHVGAPNGSLVAFDRSTGKEVWRSLDDPAGYCTPIVIDPPSGRQLVIWTPEKVNGVDPSTGKRLWSIPFKVTYNVSIATPIFRDGLLFVSGYWEGSKAIQLGPAATDAKLVWDDARKLRGLMAPPLYREGFVYLLDKQFGLTCFELKTGAKRWDDGNQMTPKGRNPQATFVWTGEDDRALILNSDGELILARFRPQGYLEESRAKIIGPTWANPAFAGDSVYARSNDEIVRVVVADRPENQASVDAIPSSLAFAAPVEKEEKPATGVPEPTVQDLLDRWKAKATGWTALKMTCEYLERHAELGPQKELTAKFQLLKSGPMRIDWLDKDENRTGVSLWTADEFRYYDMKSPGLLVFRKKGGDANETKLAEALFKLPVEFAFLFFGPTSGLTDQYDIARAADDDLTHWLRLIPRDGKTADRFRAIAVGLDKETGLPRAVAFIESPQKTIVFTLESREANPAPPLTLEGLLRELPEIPRPPGK